MLFLEDLPFPFPFPFFRIKSTIRAIMIRTTRTMRRIPHQLQQPPKLLVREKAIKEERPVDPDIVLIPASLSEKETYPE